MQRQYAWSGTMLSEKRPHPTDISTQIGILAEKLAQQAGPYHLENTLPDKVSAGTSTANFRKRAGYHGSEPRVMNIGYLARLLRFEKMFT